MISLATMGKYWHIQEFSGGGGYGGENKRKPVVTIGELRQEDFDSGSEFKILEIEEEDI